MEIFRFVLHLNNRSRSLPPPRYGRPRCPLTISTAAFSLSPLFRGNLGHSSTELALLLERCQRHSTDKNWGL